MAEELGVRIENNKPMIDYCSVKRKMMNCHSERSGVDESILIDLSTSLGETMVLGSSRMGLALPLTYLSAGRCRLT